MDTVNYLAKIFNDDDIVYVAGALLAEGKGYANPRLAKMYELDSVLASASANGAPPEFFSINPLSFTNNNIRADGSTGSYRASANVVEFKNFLLESDAIPILLQRELLVEIDKHVPIRLATFSGSKSIHMIVSVADTLFPKKIKDPIIMYKQIWEGLVNKVEAICFKYIMEHTNIMLDSDKIFDRATKDPARLSRLPMAMRSDKNVVQEVIHVGGLIAGDELLALATEAKLHQYDSTKSTIDTSVDLASFERQLRTTQSLQFLRDRLEYPDRWTSASNMYTEMFRYTLWCLDACSVSFPVLDTYFTKKVYPTILAKGYPRDPRAGVVAAYQFKGLY